MPGKATARKPAKETPKTATAKKAKTAKPAATKKTAAKKTAAKPKKPPAKPARKNQKKPEKKPETIENNALVPVTAPVEPDEPGETAIDFCGIELLPRRRDFVIYYCTPGQICFHNALQAALKAGYAPKTANSEIYHVLKDPDIQKIIRTNEDIAHRKIHSSALRAMEVKQLRAFYDPADFFEEREITIKKGRSKYVKKSVGLKALSDMTPEQRLCIDGMEMKGTPSIPIYLLPDRQQELNDLIKIDRELSKSAADTSLEETREIIMERITIRETTRAQREIDYEIMEAPDLSDDKDEDE